MRWGSAAIGLVAVVIGAAVLFGACTGPRGVGGYIRSTYQQGPNDNGARTYVSPDPPNRVASRIAEKWSPAERVNDPSGYFLRYRRDIVAVTSDGRGGSRIYVDDERRGYARWYPYVGGRWGTYSGAGETFRGGGPGAGK